MEPDVKTINLEFARKEQGWNIRLSLRALEFLGTMDGIRGLPKRKDKESPHSSPRIMKEFAYTNKIANEIDLEFVEQLGRLNSIIMLAQSNQEKLQKRLDEAQNIVNAQGQEISPDDQMVLRRAQKRLNDSQDRLRQAETDRDMILEEIARRKNINQDIRNIRIAAYWQGALKKIPTLPPNPNIEELLSLFTSKEGIIQNNE